MAISIIQHKCNSILIYLGADEVIFMLTQEIDVVKLRCIAAFGVGDDGRFKKKKQSTAYTIDKQ